MIVDYGGTQRWSVTVHCHPIRNTFTDSSFMNSATVVSKSLADIVSNVTKVAYFGSKQRTLSIVRGSRKYSYFTENQ